MNVTKYFKADEINICEIGWARNTNLVHDISIENEVRMP